MIEAIDDMPAGTIGFRGSGEIEEADLRAVAPAVREAVAGGDVRVLLVAAPGFDSAQLRSLIGRVDETLEAELGHHSDWKRVAIVTGNSWARRSHRVWGRLVPVETKLFGLDQEPAALAWLTEV
jgi:hypothetical protein